MKVSLFLHHCQLRGSLGSCSEYAKHVPVTLTRRQAVLEIVDSVSGADALLALLSKALVSHASIALQSQGIAEIVRSWRRSWR